MRFYTEKDLAMCGLACVLCSKENCPGCKKRGCQKGNNCSVYQCVTQKGIDGCYQCDTFPCDKDMLHSIRIRAFCRYAQKFGKQALLDRLRINYDNEITYHKKDGLKGDYDILETEDDILRLIQFGIHDPYIKCPILETKQFTLRLVQMEDAEDLFKCYSDPKSQEVFDATTCINDFHHKTIAETQECIRFFLDNYKNKEFIRFTVLDKESQHAVGTMEMFCATRHLAACERWGVLRIDLASPYEKEVYLSELLALSNMTYYPLMRVNRIVTKAIPDATERITALRAAGFESFNWLEPGREYYWVRDSE